VSGKRPSSAALLGVPRDWETDYQPALARLHDRLTIAAVYSPAVKESRAAAERLSSRPAHGIRAGLAREQFDGALLINGDWWSRFALEQACEQVQAVFWRVPAEIDTDLMQRLHARAATRGQLIVPEFRLRYTPATLRLRELLATELGPVRTVEIRPLGNCEVPPAEFERQLFDWCRSVLGGSIVSLRTEVIVSGAAKQRVTTLQFRKPYDEGFTVRWQLGAVQNGNRPTEESHHAPGNGLASDRWPLEFAVTCKYGEARLEDAEHIRWRLGGQERVESLANDRSAVAVALDHFARRLAGGLIPVPDLGDLLAAERCAQLAEQSLRTGQELPVEL
jgi:hypothetical protein